MTVVIANPPRRSFFEMTHFIRELTFIMNNMRVYIKSFTLAEKARGHLARNGCLCIIERTSGGGQGRGFNPRIWVRGRQAAAEVCALLGQIGIDCDIPR